MRTKLGRAVALVALLTAIAAPAAHAGGGGTDGGPDTAQLRDYAQRTWASFEAMTDPSSGLPADILNSDGSTSVQTSTTNIGAYMWSAVVARRLGFISQRELVSRMQRTLTTLEHMERFGTTG